MAQTIKNPMAYVLVARAGNAGVEIAIDTRHKIVRNRMTYNRKCKNRRNDD